MESTQRLSKETATAAVEIVMEHMTSSTQVLTLTYRLGSLASTSDDEILKAARALWKCVVQRNICKQVILDAEQRNLFPITVHALSALVCEAVDTHKSA